MKIIRAVFVLAMLAAVLPLGAQKAAAIEGTLVDSACYLKSGETGDDHGPMKECGKACLKGGTPAGVLTKDKKFYAVIAPSGVLAVHVGQTVRVSGKLNNGSVLAEKVEVSKNGKWEEVKLGAMM